MHEQDHRGEERHVTQSGDHELLARGALRGSPLRIEQHEAVQEQTGGNPRAEEQPEIACLHQHQDRRQRRQHPAREGTLPRFTVEIGGGVAQHDPAEKVDQEQHHCTDDIEAHREADVGKPDDGAGSRTKRGQQRGGGDSDQERANRGGLSQPDDYTRPTAGRDEGEEGDHDQQAGCGKRQSTDGHWFSFGRGGA